MNNFDLKKFLVENKLTTASKDINENEDLTVTGEESTPNEASKYLKHDSAQAILSELDNELALAQLEIKKEQIQKIVQEIENKISTLEEDAGMQGFVDEAAIKNKRRVVKELNRAYEQVSKLSEKMHAKYNKKKKK
jgi:cob(I)alamin adenosyltransferase